MNPLHAPHSNFMKILLPIYVLIFQVVKLTLTCTKIITTLAIFPVNVSRTVMMLCSMIGGYQLYSCPFEGVKCAAVLKMVAVSSFKRLIPTHYPTLSFHSPEYHNRKLTAGKMQIRRKIMVKGRKYTTPIQLKFLCCVIENLSKYINLDIQYS
jgi:hypothetical protein